MQNVQLLASLVLALTTAAQAQTAAGSHASSANPMPAASGTVTAVAMVDGEVRKIDKAQGKVTMKHGAIANLEMPPMTMVFRVTDPKMLDGLKDGDRVRFQADRVNGAIAITAIEPR